MTSRSCARESSSWRHKFLPVSGSKDTSASILLQRAYAAFNARDIDGALATMSPDVIWPNGMEGGTVHHHEGVRSYWTRQWGMIDPHVDPLSFREDEDGRIAVSVHQVVRDLSGNVLLDRMVEHVYTLRDGLIESMDIRE
jgi:SnoaL-like protein